MHQKVWWRKISVAQLVVVPETGKNFRSTNIYEIVKVICHAAAVQIKWTSAGPVPPCDDVKNLHLAQVDSR